FGVLLSGIIVRSDLLARWPLVDAFQIVLQNLDPAIEQRAYGQKPFLLRVDQVLGRPSRKESENLVGDRIPPIAYLIGELGFLFSRFLSHIEHSLSLNCSKNRTDRFTL